MQKPKTKKNKTLAEVDGDPGWVPYTSSCPCFTFTQVALKDPWKTVWEKPELSEDWFMLGLYGIMGELWQVFIRSLSEIGLSEDCSI